MIHISFYSTGSELNGFEVSGHSGHGSYGSDIVCAAVSSCAYMVANTLTDVIGVPADIQVRDGYMKLTVAAKDSRRIADIMKGFEIHAKALAEEYAENIICENKATAD